MALAQLTFAGGDFPAASDLLTKLIADTSDKAKKNTARVLLARISGANKDFAAAGKLVDTVLGEDPKNVDALVMRATLRLNDGKTDSAIEDLRAALNEAPQSSTVLLVLANAYERNSNFDLANDQYAKAIQIEQFRPDLALAYAQFLLRYGKADQAERVLTESRSRAPNNPQVLTLLGQLKLNRQDWVGAQEVADALRKLNDTTDTGTADQILATALSGQKKYDEAVNVLQSSISQSDPTGSPLASLVRAYVQAGKADVAEQFLTTVLTSNPKNQLAQVLMGSLHLLNKQPDQAEAAYKAAVDAAPDKPLGYQALAQYYAGSGASRSGRTDGAGWPRPRCRQWSPAIAAGDVLEREAKYDDAIDIYRKMIVVDPTSTIVANNLASLLSDYHSDPASLDEAFQIASRFRSSDIPQFLDTLGWIYYLRGDNAQALTLLKTAADKLPSNRRGAVPSRHGLQGARAERAGGQQPRPGGDCWPGPPGSRSSTRPRPRLPRSTRQRPPRAALTSRNKAHVTARTEAVCCSHSWHEN